MSTAEAQIGVNTNLQKQDLSNLDVTNLTALSPEVISRQATINIGTIGHVAHGKSTVVKAISGVQTVRFKNELERNITIKLERISKERLEAIRKSPALLKEFEERVEHSLKMRTRYSVGESSSPLNLRPKRRSYSTSPFCDPKLKTQLLSRNNSHDSLHTIGSSISSLMSSTQQRQLASSPCSGYETLTDNGSVYSCDSVDETSTVDSNKRTNMRKRAKSMCASRFVEQSTVTPTKQSAPKRRLSLSAAKVNKDKVLAKAKEEQQQAKRIKAPKGEYVVECIKCVESVNGNAVFFVKWLGYPESQNTWESLENLRDCAVLENFIEEQSLFFETTIAAISDEMESEIENDGLSYDATNLTMAQLDAFEPLNMKVDFLLLAQFRDARSRNQKEPDKIRKRLIEMLLLKPYFYMRRNQRNDLMKWQTNVNKIEQFAPISIENHVDLEVPDPKFQYILESFFNKDLQLGLKTSDDPESLTPSIGCDCECCTPSETKCCARLAGSRFAYEKNGRMRLNPGEAIYECNSGCACDKTCRNRVIQYGRKNALTIFKTATGCGWGVRTERALRKGEYVCEYVGEIISTDEANERGKRYDDIGRTYLFDLDYNLTAESVYTIDAAMFGNISHFINHSCDPNLAVFPFWIDNLDVNMPRLAFFTLRPVKAGEELNFDYIRPNGDGEGDSMVYENLSTAKKVSCRCGAANCRGVLF